MENITVMSIDRSNDLPIVNDRRILQDMIYIKRDWKLKISSEETNEISPASSANSLQNDDCCYEKKSIRSLEHRDKRDLNFLSSFLYRPDNLTEIILPPFEYVSTAMLNHAKYNRPNDKPLYDCVTEKGGTIKNILQSNKSFLHFLTTYPLKNTFRAYIQLSACLPCHAIAIPWHYAREIFSVSHNDITLTTSDSLSSRYNYGDDRIEYFFDTTNNFTLIMKRDPSIHAGSIVHISRVYILRKNLVESDSIYISGMSLCNLNADFDGDAVTIMIIRGIEAVTEISYNMNKSFLQNINVSHDRSRYHFVQSIHYTIFHMLLLGFDECKTSADLALEYKLNDKWLHDPSLVREIFLKILRSSISYERAKRIFGKFYHYYEYCARKLYTIDNNNNNTLINTVIWNKSILELMYREIYRDSGINGVQSYVDHILRFMSRERRKFVYRENYLVSLTNWIIIHSSAKGNIAIMRHIIERIENSEINDKEDEDNDDNDFFQIINNDDMEKCKSYIKDFVNISKNVPKASYFASNLKWIVQTCSIKNNQVIMNGKVILHNISRYLDFEKELMDRIKIL